VTMLNSAPSRTGRALPFKTLGLSLNIYSSALKLNTQYMHTIHFNLKLRRGITKDEVMRQFESNGGSAYQQEVLRFGLLLRSTTGCWTV
jgi:hypothetical protein